MNNVYEALVNKNDGGKEVLGKTCPATKLSTINSK
jgi:hypothetical protein